jgi:response regulator RpfG family c-di-GMP phosphodiesterase
MDGFETAAHVKKREKTRDIPILFLTAIDGGAHQAFRGYAAGAVDYLSKPFDPWVLKAKVSVFVELYERRRALAEQAADLRRQLEAYDALRLTERVVDLASAVRRAGGLADGSAAPELVTALQQAVEATQVLERALGILPESAVPGGVGA